MTGDDKAPRLVGGFAVGAHGPAIVLMLTSQSSALWLASVFRRMVGSVASMNLTADPEVDVDDVESLELRRAEKTQGKQLRERMSGCIRLDVHRRAMAYECSPPRPICRRPIGSSVSHFGGN